MHSTSKSSSADVSLLQVEKMKLEKTLNPFAAAFLPTSRQGTATEAKPSATRITSRESKIEDRTVQQNQVAEGESSPTKITSGDDSKSHEEAVDASVTNIEVPINQEHATQKVMNIHSSDDTISQKPSNGAGKDMSIEDFEVELIYLGIQFPDISEQSLADVYFANQGDLEASIDMLNELELMDNSDGSHVLGFGGGLADTSTSQKATGSGEASGSAGPSDPAAGLN